MSSLGTAFGGASRPDLGRDHGLRPAAVQRFGPVILGPAVRRPPVHASGPHTVSLFMRILVENLVAKTVSLGSPGVAELRWPLPVRPGGRLSGQMEVLETRASGSRPTMGIVRWRGEVRNQDGQLVMSLLGTNFFGCRPA